MVVVFAVWSLAMSGPSVSGLRGVFLVPVAVFLVPVAVFLVLVSDSVASENV